MSDKFAMAIDLGASNVRVAIVSLTGNIVSKVKEQTIKEGREGIAVTKQIIRLSEAVLDAIQRSNLCGIGISSIGPLDYQKGGPLNSPNIPFSFIPLVRPLKNHYNLPVYLLNDGNAAVLGEKKFGAGKKTKNLVYITLSTGIGGGAIVDGNLLYGKGGNAAEVGHILVDTSYNILCSCKKGYGHWEGLASGNNIPRFFEYWIKKEKQKTDFEVRETKDIFKALKEGNSLALGFVNELSKINAHALSTIIVAYDPELITLGGSVALNNPGSILGGIMKYLDHYLPLPIIEITKLGEDITLLGAASTAFQD